MNNQTELLREAVAIIRLYKEEDTVSKARAELRGDAFLAKRPESE